MGKNEKTPITVNDKEYFVDDMTEQEQAMVNHITDLDRKMASMRFNLTSYLDLCSVLVA